MRKLKMCMRDEKERRPLLRVSGWAAKSKAQCLLPASGRCLTVALLCSLLRSLRPQPFPGPCEEPLASLPTAAFKSRQREMPALEVLDLHPRHLLSFSAFVPQCSLVPPQEIALLSHAHGIECPRTQLRGQI